jgi:hypothetical protein
MVTKRDWLVQKGLAKAGRGKFSNAAKAEIDKAVKDGVVFDEPLTVGPKAAKPRSVKSPKAPKEPEVKQEKSTADPAAVRKWAKENGVTVSERGRVSESTKLAYEQAMDAKGGEVIHSTPGQRGEKDVRQHAPMLVSEDTVWVGTNDKPVKGVSYKTACANSGTSIGYCAEPTHRVVTADMTADLVTVRAL